ncbi:unnamed protein product [Sympodiomycopsis kandeliae]
MGGAAVGPSSGPVVGNTSFFAKANSKPLFYAAIAVFGAILYGYDGTYFTSILEMNKFQQDYGTPRPDGTVNITSSQKSILASAVQIGEFFGSLTAGFIGDRYGRRGGFLAACAYVTIGVLIQIIPAGNVAALGAGRAVLGMGVGVVSNATPLYLSEVAPSAIRGVVVSSWQLMLAIGQVIGACVGQGTHALESTASYRIPIGVNLVIVLIIVLGMFIIPESPRWLLSKDRDEEAMAALRRINSTQEDPELVASTEMRLFCQARDDERATQGRGGWKSMVSGLERRKFICVLGILVAQQIGGVQFIFSYTTTFFKTVGVTDAFLVTIIVDIVEVVGVIVSFPLIKRFGRRPLLLYTSVPMFIALLVCGILGSIGERTTDQNRTIAAMICIYVFAFNLAFGPLAWTVASELATGLNRQKLMSLGTACFWIIAWAVTFTLPYLFDADEAGLETKIGYIYAGGVLIAAIFVFFYIPETHGRSLEEIQEMLAAKVPTRHWPGHITSVQQEERPAGDFKDSEEGDVTPTEDVSKLKAVDKDSTVRTDIADSS